MPRKSPADRYDSAGALADDLRRFLLGEALVGPRTDVWYGARRAVRRWRPVIAGVALVALLFVAWLLPSPLEWFGSAPKKGQLEEKKAEPPAEKKAGPAAVPR